MIEIACGRGLAKSPLAALQLSQNKTEAPLTGDIHPCQAPGRQVGVCPNCFCKADTGAEIISDVTGSRQHDQAKRLRAAVAVSHWNTVRCDTPFTVDTDAVAAVTFGGAAAMLPVAS